LHFISRISKWLIISTNISINLSYSIQTLFNRFVWSIYYKSGSIFYTKYEDLVSSNLIISWMIYINISLRYYLFLSDSYYPSLSVIT